MSGHGHRGAPRLPRSGPRHAMLRRTFSPKRLVEARGGERARAKPWRSSGAGERALTLGWAPKRENPRRESRARTRRTRRTRGTRSGTFSWRFRRTTGWKDLGPQKASGPASLQK
ncbi:hypothetical protein AKJ09_08387 [Labilithrix luteola]|uniref:Uncharacterized protein n=1 Tax=Labilithrix luteola TaxID=1391654 RepID=A0A0K1Q7N6_9BACT|nr:hypothetical protein AKJ09_08387 [Labilithrix luteola]